MQSNIQILHKEQMKILGLKCLVLTVDLSEWRTSLYFGATVHSSTWSWFYLGLWYQRCSVGHHRPPGGNNPTWRTTSNWRRWHLWILSTLQSMGNCKLSSMKSSSDQIHFPFWGIIKMFLRQYLADETIWMLRRSNRMWDSLRCMRVWPGQYTCPALSAFLHLCLGLTLLSGGEVLRHGSVQIVYGRQQSFGMEKEVQRGELHLHTHTITSLQSCRHYTCLEQQPDHYRLHSNLIIWV